MATTAAPEKPTTDKAARIAEAAQTAIALIDSMKNSKGDIGINVPKAAKYVPQWKDEPGKPNFYAPRGNVFASGASIDRVVAAEEKRTGTKIDEIRWGKDSVVTRNEEGKFPNVKANMFALGDNHMIAKAAYQTIFDGRTETGRARQLLVANKEALHNTIREPGQDGQGIVSVSKTGLSALARVKDSNSYSAFVSADAMKEQINKTPSVAKYLSTALEEANKRYLEARDIGRAKQGGVER